MATGDAASNGSHHTQDLIERAADQMAQLDLVGKTLSSSNGSAEVSAVVSSSTGENGVKGPASAPAKKTPAKQPASSTPGSGRTSRKPSTSNATKTSVDQPKPEEPPKKLPMNKIKVGSAASPNIKQVKSKIGSLSTVSTYKPSGGNVKIESKKLNWKAESKVGSMGNVKHRPGGGDKKIFDDKEYLKRCSPGSSAGHGSKTPSEGVGSPKGTMSPTPMSPAPGVIDDNGTV